MAQLQFGMLGLIVVAEHSHHRVGGEFHASVIGIGYFAHEEVIVAVMQHHGALEAVIGKESASAISQVIVSAAEGIAIDVASEILHRFGNGVIHSEIRPEALIFFISWCGITYHHIGAFGEVAAHIHKPVGPCRTAVGVGHHYQFVAGGFDAKHYGKFAARHIATAVGDKCLA